MEELNKEILNKIDELIDIIKQVPEYKKYLKLKNKIREDEDLVNTINLIKKYQKELIKNPSIDTNNKLDKLNKDLNYNILYIEYINSIKDINSYLDLIKKLEDYLVDITK